jgi:dehydrogenase/reductase SDR family member 7B
MKFHGKRVWITGASSGIGEAMARQLAGKVALLIISGLEKEDLETIRNSIPSDQGIVVALPFDLGDFVQVENAAKEVLEKFGGVDILINNGGISQRGYSAETTIAVDRHIMEVNFFSQVRLAKLILPAMLEQGSGHIAVTSSMVGKFGFPLRSSYAASKHALQGYFETVGLEYYHQGIRTTIASPGRIRTNISVNAILGTGQKYGLMDPGQASGMSAEKCAKRYIRAIERNQWEVYIGNSEILMIWFKRFIPALFRRLALRVSVK